MIKHILLITILILLPGQTILSEIITEHVPVVFDRDEIDVYEVLIDKDSFVYAQTDYGVFKYHVGDSSWEQIVSFYPHDIALDSNGTLWICSTGIFVKYEDGVCTYYQDEALDDYDGIALIAPQNEHAIWGASVNHDGVVKYDLSDSTSSHFTMDDGLQYSWAHLITATDDGQVWVSHTDRFRCEVCSYNGISHFDGNKWEGYTEDSGLLHKQVTSIAALSSSEVYIASPKGVVTYKEGRLEPFNTSYNVDALTEGMDGTLWAAGHKLVDRQFVIVEFVGNTANEYIWDSPPEGYIYNMDFSKDGVLWATINGKLHKIEITDVVNVDTLPEERSISLASFPNPFNPSTTISFEIPDQCQVTLEVFNVAGQKVDTLVDGIMPAGSHAVQWQSPGDQAAGIYFCRLQAGAQVRIVKMLYLK